MVYVFVFLIANTTHWHSAVLIVAATAAHAGATVVEGEVVRVTAAVLGSTPEVGGVAEILVTAGVPASGQRTEASGVVVGGCVAWGTGVSAAVPACGGSKRLGYVGSRASALILALRTQVVG